MQKELNPELFGTGVSGSTRYRDEEAPSSNRQGMYLEEKIAEIRSQVKFTTDQMEGLVIQVNEFLKTSQSKFDRLQASVKTVEQTDKLTRAEVGQKVSLMNQKLNERKSWDIKVQELIDRQNGVLRSYEVRLNHLQELLKEKDAQLIKAQATMNEAKMEISRLKRL